MTAQMIAAVIAASTGCGTRDGANRYTATAMSPATMSTAGEMTCRPRYTYSAPVRPPVMMNDGAPMPATVAPPATTAASRGSRRSRGLGSRPTWIPSCPGLRRPVCWRDAR